MKMKYWVITYETRAPVIGGNSVFRQCLFFGTIGQWLGEYAKTPNNFRLINQVEISAEEYERLGDFITEL